jgi:hypothetical protein
MTPSNIIDTVRRVLQDSVFLRTPDTYSAATLLVFVNNAIKRMVMLRPDLFTVVANIPTTASSAIQTMPSDSFRLVEIFQVVNGNTLEEVDRDQFDRTNINWATEPAGVPVKYMRHARSPNKYFLYPRPVANTQLVAEYVKIQPTYGLNDTIVGLPDDYLPSLVDGTIYVALSVENADNVTQVGMERAKMFYTSFTQSLGVSLQARVLTDFEDGLVRPPTGEAR